ncbi:hypothetical protein FQR65_LT02366 [Abscondita terminalis]|nr:hypothetical protein FQR65_LT02366 [Abscondita terminalis]
MLNSQVATEFGSRGWRRQDDWLACCDLPHEEFIAPSYFSKRNNATSGKVLSDEDKGNSFGVSSSGEYEPSEDSSSDTNSNLENFSPRKKQNYKNNRSTAFQDSLPSTSSGVTGNPEANSVQQTIEEVIRNIAAQRNDENDNEIQAEA